MKGLNPVSWVSGMSSAGLDYVWAVGPVGLSIHYDGHAWKQAPLPDLGGDESWLQNVRTDPRFGTWAVGYRVGSDHVRKPLVVRWCDGAWQLVATPDAAYTQLQDVAFTHAGPEAFGYVDSPTAAQTAYGIQLPVRPTGQARPIAVPSESTGVNGVLAQPGGRGLWIVGTGAVTDNSTVAPFAAHSNGDPADR